MNCTVLILEGWKKVCICESMCIVKNQEVVYTCYNTERFKHQDKSWMRNKWRAEITVLDIMKVVLEKQ